MSAFYSPGKRRFAAPDCYVGNLVCLLSLLRLVYCQIGGGRVLSWGGVTCAPVETGPSSAPGSVPVRSAGSWLDGAPTVGSSPVALAVGPAERSCFV